MTTGDGGNRGLGKGEYMKKAICMVLFFLILCGCSGIPDTVPDEPTEANVKPAIILPAGTATQEDCRLCGGNSLWGYYSKFDSIGVLNLSNGHISNIEIFAYEDDGSIRDNSGYSSMRHNSDDDGHWSNMTTMGGRGICDLSLSWAKGKFLDLKTIAKLYCKECMKKITVMDEEWTENLQEKGRCPFALIDFTDGKLYSLNGIVTACFIRDYYMYFEFGERTIDGVIVYAPERTFE